MAPRRLEKALGTAERLAMGVGVRARTCVCVCVCVCVFRVGEGMGCCCLFQDLERQDSIVVN